jgi:endonuclease/exonuclease/phosphatase family metal-dependent hydrolase
MFAATPPVAPVILHECVLCCRFLEHSGRWGRKKCPNIAACISDLAPKIILLQETKLSSLSATKAASFLPPALRLYFVVDAYGSSGGLLTAWDSNFCTLVASVPSRHALSIDFALGSDGSQVRVTNVYTLCLHSEKADFRANLATHEPPDNVPWLVAGDFHLARSPDDRNNDNFSASEASMFNSTINDLCLLELPLRDRMYTWSNRRDSPVLIRLDRVFVNATWNLLFPASTLTSRARDTSDHVPLAAAISTSIPRSHVFRFEKS